ncbi:MAG: Queuine tRNA-ribosyltransferase, partial [Candidatus Gottesmanbacteria bacterium GW2011_GWA1_42_26]
FSRAYIHHLFRVRELLAYRLATIHNLHFVLELVKNIRSSITDGTYLQFKEKFFKI